MLSLLFALGGLVAFPAPCVAQEAQQRAASARLLFRQGVERGDAGDWAGAVDAFQRALALRESSVIRFNLAQALEHEGRLVEASEHLRRVEHDPEADDELRTEAHDALTAIEPRLGTVTLRVEGEPPEGSEVMLDAAVLLPVQLGVPIPADPGAHRAELRVKEEIADEATLEVTEGGHAEALLKYASAAVPSPADAAATLADEQAAEPVPASTPAPVRRRRRIAGFTAAAAVVVGAVVAGVVLATRGGDDGPPSFEPPELTVPP